MVRAHRARQDRRERILRADLLNGTRDEWHQCIWLSRRVQLVAQLPGKDHVARAARLNGAHQVAHELQIGAAPVAGIEGQQQLYVVVHPAGASGRLARHSAVVVDEGDDESDVRRAQDRRNFGDARADTGAVPIVQAIVVGAKNADDAAAQPARIRNVLLDVAELGVEEHPVVVDQQKAAVEWIGGRDARRASRHHRRLTHLPVGPGDGHHAQHDEQRRRQDQAYLSRRRALHWYLDCLRGAATMSKGFLRRRGTNVQLF